MSLLIRAGIKVNPPAAVHGSFSRVLYPDKWFEICHVNQTTDVYITRARDDPSLPVASSGINAPSS